MAGPDYSEWYRNNPMYEEGPGGIAHLKTQPGTPAAGQSGFVPYQDLASSTNAFMTGEAKAPFVSNLPDYENLVAQRSKNIGAELRGEVPQDVVNQILQQGAERGIMTGSPGSPNSNAAMLRALGLTSREMQQQGSANLSRSISDTPVPQLFYPQSLFVPQTLAAQSLAAAQSGLTRGGDAGGAGRGYGAHSVSLPGGSLGGGAGNQPASWERGYGAIGGGRTGYFDETPYSGPSWDQLYGPSRWDDISRQNYTGGGYGVGDDWSNMFDDLGESDWSNPNAPIYQPAQDFNWNDMGDYFFDNP
jgi:hypothetical protein